MAELKRLKESGRRKLFFFVDDNITSNRAEAKAFFRDLAPLGIRWVSQSSIDAAHDEEFLDLAIASGCDHANRYCCGAVAAALLRDCHWRTRCSRPSGQSGD